MSSLNMTETIKTCPKCGKPTIQALISGQTFETHSCGPYRLVPYTPSNSNHKLCFSCKKRIDKVDYGDNSTGTYYRCNNENCKKYNEIVHSSMTVEPHGIRPLGTLKSKRASTTFIAVSANKRTINQGVRSNPNLPKNRKFDRNVSDTELGYRIEDLPELAGKPDWDLINFCKTGVIASIISSEGEEE